MFPPELAAVCARLSIEHGVHVVYAGLKTTWRGQTFATTAAVLGLPGFKGYSHKAFCEPCASRIPTATVTQKLRDGIPINVLDPDEPTFDVGYAQYKPLCLPHWFGSTPGSYEALRRGLIGIVDPVTEWRKTA